MYSSALHIGLSLDRWSEIKYCVLYYAYKMVPLKNL